LMDGLQAFGKMVNRVQIAAAHLLDERVRHSEARVYPAQGAPQDTPSGENGR
jgi:hypothetical protein